MESIKQNKVKSQSRKWPVHGWIGLALVLVFWVLNWSLQGLRTLYVFFPLWLGYCLTVDALVFWRKGNSMLTRSLGAYFKLFLISAPVWWLFELFNLRTQNWFYDGKQFFTGFEYFLLATLNFSIVIPAVFGTAELVSTFNWLKRIKPGPKINSAPLTLLCFFITGCLIVILILIWPIYFFPLIWLSVYLIVEAINYMLKYLTLMHYIALGDWRPVLALWIGCLICGFFWEMWNFYSYPKWIYRIPFVNFIHIFEMPLLGYSGYLPFSMELFALYHLIINLFKQKERIDYIQVCP